MIGMDRRTGKVISGLEHYDQSLEVMMTTARGARVVRRHLGVDARLVDNPIYANSGTVWTYNLVQCFKSFLETRGRINSVEILSVNSVQGQLNLNVNFQYNEGTGKLETQEKSTSFYNLNL